MICTFHKCYEMNYSINSWKQIIIANDIKAKEKVLKTKLKTRSRFSNDSKTGLAWRDDRTSGWQLDWSGNDFMPRLMSTPAGVCCGSSPAGVTRCRGFRVHDAGAGGSQLHGNGVASTGWRTRFVYLQASVVFARFFVCIVCCTLYFNGHFGASAIAVIVMHCNDYYGRRISYLKGL